MVITENNIIKTKNCSSDIDFGSISEAVQFIDGLQKSNYAFLFFCMLKEVYVATCIIMGEFAVYH